MHGDNPVGGLHTVFELLVVLVLCFLDAREVEEVDRVEVELGDDVWVERLLGAQREVREHFLCVEDYFVRVADH